MNLITILIVAGYLAGILWVVACVATSKDVDEDDVEVYSLGWWIGVTIVGIVWPILFTMGTIKGIQELIDEERA